MIGERLLRARNAAGLSMDALAKRVGLSANMIKKYEHNTSMPSSSVLLKLARELNVRTEYFFRPQKVELAGIEYRKRSSTPKNLLKRIEADVLDQAERWQELINLWPNYPIAPFAKPNFIPDIIHSLDEVDRLADELRDYWSLGLNAIPDLIDELEKRGILVILTDADTSAKFDGLQAHIGQQPVIVLSQNWTGDRQRFTIAHELGHLILHANLSDKLDEEMACNRFASAFLIPASSMYQNLGQKRQMLEMRELHMLKMDFGLSMQGCLYRACDLGIITPSVRQRIFMVFSKNGWRKQEPGESYPAEHTNLFQQLVFRAHGEGIIGESKAAELLALPAYQFHSIRKMELINEAVN